MNGSGRLEVETAKESSEVTVTIRDNGIGIADKDLPRIFEPFFSTKANGTGLGLSVVKGIIEEHRGKIVITSMKGQGTQVQLKLPIISQG